MATPTTAAPAVETVKIAHICDPQVGFGSGGIDADLEAFAVEVENINRAGVDAVLIAGDMVNRMDTASIRRFKEVAAAIEAPVILTPGNHDIAEPCTAEGLALYRDAFGSDFSVNDIKGCTVISFNSLLLRGGPAEEVEHQKALLYSALDEARNGGKCIIMLSHVPPFAVDVDEADEYFNLPKTIRRDILDRFRDAGVRFWLAGHTHRMHSNEYGGIHILNGETTSSNFDKRPLGFRLLTLRPDGSFCWEFVPNAVAEE